MQTFVESEKVHCVSRMIFFHKPGITQGLAIYRPKYQVYAVACQYFLLKDLIISSGSIADKSITGPSVTYNRKCHDSEPKALRAHLPEPETIPATKAVKIPRFEIGITPVEPRNRSSMSFQLWNQKPFRFHYRNQKPIQFYYFGQTRISASST